MISTLLREPARIAALRTTPAGLRRLRAKASALVSGCRKYPELMRGHWDALQAMAEASARPIEDLKPYFNLLLSMIDVCLGTTEARREGLEEAAADAGALSALCEAAAALRSLRDEVASVWKWLASPPGKRSLRATAEIRAGIARGEYIAIEEAIAQAGAGPAGTA